MIFECGIHRFASTVNNYCPFCRLNEVTKLATRILKRNQGGYVGDRRDVEEIKRIAECDPC